MWYLQSPDCPLCISLMELHSNKKQCAEFILDCAHSVSLQLMPNDSGQLNEEIDKQFVIGYVIIYVTQCYFYQWDMHSLVCIMLLYIFIIVRIIRYLLLSAKVKFSTAGCHDSVELCDTWVKFPSVHRRTNFICIFYAVILVELIYWRCLFLLITRKFLQFKN